MAGEAGRPRIGVMIGDPGGIGPEVCVKALATGEPQRLADVVLIGNLHVVESAAKAAGVSMSVQAVESAAGASGELFIPVLDSGSLRPEDYRIGASSAASGRAVKQWIDKATALSNSGELDGWIMAPVNTTSLKDAGVLKDIDDLQPPGTFMFRLSGPLRVVPISEHLRIKDVAAAVTADRVLHVIRLVDKHLRRWGIAAPRIGVAGLNPHAMFEEDIEEIAPAVARAKAEGLSAEGPVPPDSVFRQCIEDRYDAVVTMYHDQGQIAVKTSVFEGACTVYLGLPYVQLSVPHGTAYDIAGTGKAQHRSMLAAMKTAAMLVAGKGFLHIPAERAA
ncbi:4-hydroxythreonine-4-phosphate dehydrogenase PdxA [Aquibium sp. LZ166]|uniref:4-hydroxythreonine-4-phosphate dehydrogenase PdxA n=1 Tax=Aquibium pacificus TaxID=3153579 RepID=A0ABV3SEU2_9HYPH